MHIPESVALCRSVTAEERATFDRDGVVHLRGIYPMEWVNYLEAQLDDAFDGQPQRSADQRSVSGDRRAGIRVDMAELADGIRASGVPVALEDGIDATVSGRSIVETDASAWHAGMRLHNVQGPLPELVASLVESPKVIFYADQLFLKEPGSQIRTPFHQDQPYFLVQGLVTVCWVPVDVVGPDNGPMGYVRGSHRWGKLFKPSDFVTDSGTFPENDGIDHSDLEVMPPITADQHDVVYFQAEPGDVIVHHWSTVHGAAGNVSAKAVRRAASVRYASGDSTYHQRPSSPEPFRHTTGLKNCEPLERADRFAVVWPRP